MQCPVLQPVHRKPTNTHLHRDLLVVNLNLLCQEVGTNGGLVLLRKLLLNILVHKRSLADSGCTQSRDNQQCVFAFSQAGFCSFCHFRCQTCMPALKPRRVHVAATHPLSPRMMIFNNLRLLMEDIFDACDLLVCVELGLFKGKAGPGYRWL